MACCHTGCGYQPEMTDIYIAQTGLHAAETTHGSRDILALSARRDYKLVSRALLLVLLLLYSITR